MAVTGNFVLEMHQHCLRVGNLESRVLAQEAVKAYSAGAYRAAIACIWVAVVTDIRMKISLLAPSEATARDWEEEYEEALRDLSNTQPSHAKVQKLENGILDFAFKKLELITAREYEELNRLRRDRNLCVHPNSLASGELFSPGPELARLHIVSAVESLLSQGVRVGRSLLSTLEKEMNQASWPQPKEAGEYFLERYYRSARSATRKALVSVLIKNAVFVQSTANRFRYRSRTLLPVVAEEDPEVFAERLAHEFRKAEQASISEEALMRAVGALGFTDQFRLAMS